MKLTRFVLKLRRISTTFQNFLGQEKLKLVILHTLKHGRLTVSMIPAILVVKKSECSLIRMSLTIAAETKENSR